jgi:hypothetical protein
MRKDDRIVSYDWNQYNQRNIVYRPALMSAEQLRDGHSRAFRTFYSLPSMARRFPARGPRSRSQWSIYNVFFK